MNPQVKKKQYERRSQTKEATPTSIGHTGNSEGYNNVQAVSTSNTSRNSSVVQNDKEELEFNFDEDLDIPQGRQNKFSSV